MEVDSKETQTQTQTQIKARTSDDIQFSQLEKQFRFMIPFFQKENTGSIFLNFLLIPFNNLINYFFFLK